KNLTSVTLADTLTSVFGVPEEEAQRAIRDAEREERPGNDPQLAVPDAAPPVPEAQPQQQQTTIVTPLAAQGTGASVSANLSVTIIADEDTNTLLIRATPREYRQLLSTISSLDTQPPQVLINA